MKFKIKVEDQTYDVEVGELNRRPIIVLVDGEVFSVWPEENPDEEPVAYNTVPSEIQPVPVPQTDQMAKPALMRIVTEVRAPIPGVITAISVRLGDKIAVGDELCKLEAMKMNNSIRANRTGSIGVIHVNVGQQVKHGDLLIEFAEG